MRQELFAMLIMTVIARVLMVLRTDPEHPSGGHPQFKHAILTLASEAALLAPTYPDVALGIFQELLREIERVRYYPPKMPRPSAPTGNFNTKSRLSGTKHETLRQTNHFIGVRLELYNSSLTPIGQVFRSKSWHSRQLSFVVDDSANIARESMYDNESWKLRRFRYPDMYELIKDSYIPQPPLRWRLAPVT